VLNT